MSRQAVTRKLLLRPFPEEESPPDFRVSVLFSKIPSGLFVVFELTASLEELIVPEFNPADAQRKDNLWKHTCFEIFLAQEGTPDYWEFNLSPSGDWNVYSFTGYRQGMTQEAAFRKIQFEVQRPSENKLRLQVIIDLNLISVDSDIEAGFSAVLETKDMKKTWWALSHSGNVPDFHDREGWLKSC